jgi:hypothetical protein
MINGVANFSTDGKMIPDKIGVSVIISNLDQINMILNSPKLELKNPLAGQIKLVDDDHGNNIEIHLSNNDSGTVTGRNNISNQSIHVDNKFGQNIVNGDHNQESRDTINQLVGSSEVGEES